MEVHIEMRNIAELILHLLLHTGIFGKDHPDIKIFLINTLGERAHYICQSPCFNKWYTL